MVRYENLYITRVLLNCGALAINFKCVYTFGSLSVIFKGDYYFLLSYLFYFFFLHV